MSDCERPKRREVALGLLKEFMGSNGVPAHQNGTDPNDVEALPETSIPTRESESASSELASSQLHYVLIPEAALDATKPLSFDLFVRIGEKYIKVFKKGEEPDRTRMATYRERADDVLYIRSFELEQSCASHKPKLKRFGLSHLDHRNQSSARR